MDREETLKQADQYIRDNKLDKALKEYHKLLADEPSDMRVKLKMGELYSKKNEGEKAIFIYREVGESYEKDNFHLKAIAVYKSILKLNPTLIDINERLGGLFQKVGLTSEAIHELMIVASYYDSKGMQNEALGVHQKISELDPDNAAALVKLAELYQSDGKTDESIATYEKAAAIFKKKKDLKGLVEVYQKVLFHRPDSVPMFRSLVKIYLDRGEYDKVLQHLDKAPEETKKDPMVKQILAETFVGKKQLEQARRMFKEIYANYVEAKDAKACTQLYSRILQEFSDDPDYMKSIDAVRTKAGFDHPISDASHREDMERTTLGETRK